jgi:hypothetical protein
MRAAVLVFYFTQSASASAMPMGARIEPRGAATSTGNLQRPERLANVPARMLPWAKLLASDIIVSMMVQTERRGDGNGAVEEAT